MTLAQLARTFVDRLLDDFDRMLVGDAEPDLPHEDDAEVYRNTLDVQEASLARLDAKAGAVLTHISMMIAAATFVISGDSGVSPVEKLIIVFELSLYLFAALCCLRCLIFRERMFDPVHKGAKNEYAALRTYGRSIAVQVYRFGSILNLAVRMTFLVTFVFSLSLIAHIML